MHGRTHLKVLMIPVLLAMATLVAVEQAGAWCNTPRPAIPRGGGVPTIPGSPGAATPGARRTGPGTGGTFGLDGSWRIWWDFNREHILGLQGVTDIEGSGEENESAIDPIGRERGLARAALERIALSGVHEDIRGAALCALGREGNLRNAEIFIRILKAPGQRKEVLQGAAIGLAMLPQIDNEEHRETVRKYYRALVADRVKMPELSRLVNLTVLSMRGASDPALVRILAKKLERPGVDANEVSALLLGSGLPRSDLASLFLVQVVDSGKVGKRKLTDVARSHAVLALALAGGPDAAPTLLKLIDGDKVQVHTRRSSAIGLGRLLETGGLGNDLYVKIGKVLRENMYGDPDPLVRSYSIIALGLSRRPYDPDSLIECLGKRGDGTSRPYAALALGLAARNLPPGEARQARETLISEFKKSRGSELPGALCIALGLARATEGADLIAMQVSNRKVNPSLRGPACQALGLLGGDDPKHEQALLIALNGKNDEVAQNAALGIGLRGGENSAKLLVKMLAVTGSPMMQAHMVTGLSHLGGADAIEPLIEILGNSGKKRDTRISAATALGLIIARRERDLLFELDAYTNPFGLTEASRVLAQVF